jgi:hypothetical protein
MKRKGIWLGVAAILLALSAWLMSRGDKEKPTVRPPKVAFPHGSKPEEETRNQKRRTLPPLKSDDQEGFRRKRDPLLVALPTDPKRSAMVFEVGALRESPIMKVWIECMLAKNDRETRDLDRFKKRFGIDPLADVERVAFSSEKLTLLQGSFGKASFEGEGWTKRTYGEKGVIYENPESGRVVGTWGPDMLMMSGAGYAPELIQDAIDRLESNDPSQRPILNDYQAYGDAYGVLSPDDLAKMLPHDRAALAEKSKSVVEHVDFHADASEDVAMTAEVRGLSAEGRGKDDMEDLAKSFGAALAVGRIKAQNDGDEKLAELLDYAKVKPFGGGGFSVDVALPFEMLKELGPCKKDDEPPPARAVPAPASADPAPRRSD